MKTPAIASHFTSSSSGEVRVCPVDAGFRRLQSAHSLGAVNLSWRILSPQGLVVNLLICIGWIIIRELKEINYFHGD